MKPFYLFPLFMLLIVIDRVTTWIAIDKKFGEEINPYVSTDSFLSIVLSPVPLALCGFFVVCLILSEIYSDQIHSLLLRKSPLAPICLLPLFSIWMMIFVCINNTFALLGYITPLTWFSLTFHFITDDGFLLFAIALNILNIAGLPLLTRIGLRIYAPKQRVATR